MVMFIVCLIGLFCIPTIFLALVSLIGLLAISISLIGKLKITGYHTLIRV